MDAFPLLATPKPTVRCHGIRANGSTCGRWLRDAESVAARMGPDCRERAGLMSPRRPRFGAVSSGAAEATLFDMINEGVPMRDFPHYLGERVAIRAQIDERAKLDAMHKANALGRSMKCAGYPEGGYGPPAVKARHAGDEDGCANDGTGCICDCHDPAGA